MKVYCKYAEWTLCNQISYNLIEWPEGQVAIPAPNSNVCICLGSYDECYKLSTFSQPNICLVVILLHVKIDSLYSFLISKM